MQSSLKLSIGQYSDKGCKPTNQDFHGALVPKEPQLSMKGAAVVLADGISSSDVSQIASETAVKGFLLDYFCTSDAWSVQHSAARVLDATNSWLFSQTQKSEYRFDKDRGYVCTFSGIVFKAASAHLFHVGDSRIYRLHSNALEQLTNDHRLYVSQEESYLSRAMGMAPELGLDYRTVPVKAGDLFLLATDGVYEYLDAAPVLNALEQSESLDDAARLLVEQALAAGSDDNLTVQLVRVDQLPSTSVPGLQQQIEALPFAPELEARMQFDGYEILRELHRTSRSHVFLAQDLDTGERVVIKTPSVDLRGDPEYLERFLLEEWIARRINSAHVLKAPAQVRPRNYIYTVTEYIEGQTLKQWLVDNPDPSLEVVRGIIEQVARGLQGFHRKEMLHQDLKPDNIMIDGSGTVKIIDFGSTQVAGLDEITRSEEVGGILGTALYTAPEYFMGEAGSARSDQFSLGVLAYYMLSGRFPYGTAVAKAKTPAAQRRLSYDSVRDEHSEIPAWVDEALQKAVHLNPYKRYEEISEFTYALRQPSQAFLNRTRAPLMARNPVAFWQGVSLLLALVIVVLLNR